MTTAAVLTFAVSTLSLQCSVFLSPAAWPTRRYNVIVIMLNVNVTAAPLVNKIKCKFMISDKFALN